MEEITIVEEIMVKPSKRAYSLGSPLSDLTPAPIVAQRNPTANDINYEIGQPWVNKSANRYYVLTSVTSGAATWTIASPGASDVDTITGDSGGALSPSGGNITIAGGTGITTSGSGSTLTIDAAAGTASISEYVVDAAGGADYTTIQSALDAANGAGGGVLYIRPGTYTEDLTLYDGVDLYGTPAVSQNVGASVSIIGTHTPPASGHVGFNSIYFQDTSAVFSSGAAGTCHLVFLNCESAVQNGYFCSLPNWTGILEIWDHNPSASGAPFAVQDGGINNTGGATIFAFSAGIGWGTSNTMNLSGTVVAGDIDFGCPVNFQGSADLSVYGSDFLGPVTLSGSATGFIETSSFDAGSSAAITMSSGAAVRVTTSRITSTNNPAIDGAGAGTLTLGDLVFTSNTALAATLTLARTTTVDGTVRATTFDTDVAAAGVTLSGTTLAADGTDADISLTFTPKGAGSVSVSAGDAIVSSGNAGGDRTIEVTNTDNTMATSRAGFEAAVGGTSAGDPYVNFLISGGQTFTMGIDNSSTNDDFVISDSAALGTTNRLVIDGSTGDTSVTGNLALPTAATQLQVEGGAVTDFIGQATLAAGTVTVANTNIAAGDRIICTRSSINSSTALGILVTSISAGANFTITAVQPGTPGSPETNDTSIVDYFIVREL